MLGLDDKIWQQKKQVTCGVQGGRTPQSGGQQLLLDQVHLLMDEGVHPGRALLQLHLDLQALPSCIAVQSILLDAGLLPRYEVLQGYAPM